MKLLQSLNRLALMLAMLIVFVAASLGHAPSALAAGMTDFLENELLDHTFRARAYTAPAALYVRLCTAAGTDATGCTEATYTGYARGQLNPSVSNWKGSNGEVTAVDSAGTSGTTSNAAIITVGAAATSGPQVVTHFEVMDAPTGGNRLFWAALTASKTINNGDPAPTFAVDALTVQFDN